jgi:N-acyl-D-amino-acid deacylase
MVRQGGTTTIGGERSLNSKVIRSIAQNGFLINQGFSVSHSFIIRNAVGISDNRPATESEIRGTENIAIRFLESGAFGICFGLELVPGTSYEEIRTLSRLAVRYKCPIIIHMRKDGREALKYFPEILNVARETGARVHLLQLLYMVGIGGAMPEALDILDRAREEHLDITADSGVYDTFSACIGTGIFDDGWEEEYPGFSVANLLISSGIYKGQYCDEDLFRYLRKQHPETLVSASTCDDDAIAMTLKKDFIYVSTNASDGPHYLNVGAPEASGTFPRLLGRNVRELGDLSLIEALRKITILPAKRYGLKNIGSLEVGNFADVVIFDADTILDNAAFVDKGDPNAPPDGISHVLVNGKIVVKNNALTENTHAGRLLWKTDAATD